MYFLVKNKMVSGNLVFSGVGLDDTCGYLPTHNHMIPIHIL